MDDIDEIEQALKTLTDHIGCYGERIAEPVSITWGNGIDIRVNGVLQAGGRPRVTGWIKDHSRKPICSSPDCQRRGECNAFDPEIECPITAQDAEMPETQSESVLLLKSIDEVLQRQAVAMEKQAAAVAKQIESAMEVDNLRKQLLCEQIESARYQRVNAQVENSGGVYFGFPDTAYEASSAGQNSNSNHTDTNDG